MNDAGKTDYDPTEGWPDEPGNAQLAELAEGIRRSRPVLGGEAMARIERSFRRELEAACSPRAQPASRQAGERRGSRLWFAAAAAAAAVVLLATGLSLLHPPRPRPGAPPSLAGPDPQAAPGSPVSDSFLVDLRLPAPEAPDRPLVPLARYEGLYAEPQISRR